MLSLLEKSEKLVWGLKWFGIVLLAVLVAWEVPQGVYLIDGFLAKCGTSLGGDTNVFIAYAILPLLFVAPFILIRLKPVSLIAVTVALFPFFSRTRNFFGIYGYTTFYNSPHLIAGMDLFVPLLFGYLLFRYPPNTQGWWLPSSRAFWLLAASGVLTQFIFFSPFLAIRIAYLVIVVQLLWYLIIVAYVNTMEDVYKVMWGMVIGTFLSVFLSNVAGGRELILNPQILYNLEGRLGSIVLGSINEYPVILSSTICLLPILFFRSHKWVKLLILLLAILFYRDLLLTVTRGGFLSLLSILGYLFFLRRKKFIVIFTILICMSLYAFWDQITFFLNLRGSSYDLNLSYNLRYLRWASAWESLTAWPYFLTGLGMRTYNNYIPLTHSVHQGFLHVWVTTGLPGILGFSFWLFYSMWKGFREAIRSHKFEEKLVLTGLVLSITCWVVLFLVTKGLYTGGQQEMYAILTTQVALLVVLGQKQRTNK